MKKKYINPTTSIIKINTVQMIASSPIPVLDTEEETDVMESRRRRDTWGNIWDDEEEDEEEDE